MPVDTGEKADHLEVLPLISVKKAEAKEAQSFSVLENGLEVFFNCLEETDTDLLLTSPALVDSAFKSRVAQVAFEGSRQFDRFLPQSIPAVLAFGCGRVTAHTLEVASSYATVSAVFEGSVIASNRTLQQSLDHQIMTVLAKGPISLGFPYSPKENVFVTQAFVDLCRLHRIYNQDEKLPDGTSLDAYPQLPDNLKKSIASAPPLV